MDYDCRFLSPNVGEEHYQHSRTRSFKGRPRSKDHEDAQFRPRRNSMPSHPHRNMSSSFNDLQDKQNDEQPLCRVRSFKTTSKGGVVNRGDSFKRKSKREQFTPPGNITVENSDPCPEENEESTPRSNAYTVIVLGPAGVGKTLLTTQFMTSEYILGTSSENNEGEERTVSVLLDGEESTLNFVDPSRDEMDVEEGSVDAYIVVFSVNDRSTFEIAVDTLYQIRQELASHKAVILVANKIDIVRKRLITSDEARAAANQYDCKYAETSAALNHHVDELLVGILSQIRLKNNPEAVEEHESHKRPKERRKGSFRVAKGLLNKLFRKSSKRDKSCDNLYEL